ncbi:twin-arginine translocase TatA/TatE family subunit [Alkaliphilus peptidifermentans]|uniref:Sec-independent protein translocase protein TatA n=1 Tax=Alkaliphilus peptidifermentans DSM 18978 TaxID=1120976 RepID=A0A1G5EWT0_9FIRM|nr:twin-arginine translocase TatA/TatE family subunit [Alkaliphilus peptidifermentans]SCY31465.1 Sec-independent protein translocase TatA [Alkaliphilus peptidifermentans DSM 18978]
MFGKLGAPELILILVLALVVFGPSKLPEIGKALGKGIKEFKAHTSNITSEISGDVDKKE